MSLVTANRMFRGAWNKTSRSMVVATSSTNNTIMMNNPVVSFGNNNKIGMMMGGGRRRWMSVITLSDDTAIEKFRKIHNKSILYFTATWCPPCKMIGPVYEKLSNDYSDDDIAFGKVDIDDNGDAAMDHDIRAVPTFVFFSGDTITERFTGADTNALEEKISTLKNL